MYICNEHNEEIVHESRKCPACAEIKELQSQLKKAEEKIDDLKQEVSDLS